MLLNYLLFVNIEYTIKKKYLHEYSMLSAAVILFNEGT